MEAGRESAGERRDGIISLLGSPAEVESVGIVKDSVELKRNKVRNYAFIMSISRTHVWWEVIELERDAVFA